jgi:glycosyltransferase involved in cell wall biosynthesis
VTRRSALSKGADNGTDAAHGSEPSPSPTDRADGRSRLRVARVCAGFGHGNPERVITEVVGDAGLLVASADPAELAACLMRVTGSERAPLARAAFERSRVFTWERAAEQTMGAYRGAINAPPR